MPDHRPPHDDADEPEFARDPHARGEPDAGGGAAGEGDDEAGHGRADEVEASATSDEAGDPLDDDAHDAEPDDDAGEDDDDEEEESVLEGGHRVVFVSTAIPVAISVGPLDDERAPEGSALATYIGERLVARCAMPGEAIERLMELDLFSEPVPLALLAVEEEPGLQCRLFALVPAERLADAEADDEPWKASVPSFEESLDDDDDDDDEEADPVLRAAAGAADDGDDEEDEEEEEGAVASILLGHIVRFQHDRKFADDLAAEAVDVLQKIVLGGTLEDANAKAVDALLKSL